MIGFLRGTIIGSFLSGKKNVFLTLWPYESRDANGVGYSVLVSMVMATKYTVGTIASFWIYHVVGEKESYLVGLDEKEKLDIFNKLLDVSGVGPKSALQIVDILGVSGVQDAIKEKNVTAFSKISGIGGKTAGKIVLELTGVFDDSLIINGNITGVSSIINDISTALRSLGYSDKEAHLMIKSAEPELLTKVNEKADLGEILKVIFKYAKV